MMDTQEEEPIVPMTQQEERELRRVFERLCDFHKKMRLAQAIEPRVERMDELKKKYTVYEEPEPEDVWKMEEKTPEQLEREREARGRLEIPEGPERAEWATLSAEVEQHRAELAALERPPAGAPEQKIRPADLLEAARFLGRPATRKDVQDVIWEVDENLDGAVDWEEFRLMFERNVGDRTGLEPAQLYHMAQFMMYDARNTGRVTVDQTMSMLYARYGKAKMEAKLKILFGRDMKESGTEGGAITFQQYLMAVQKTQLETFLATSLGKKIAKKLGDAETLMKK
uniref:EF-hand domain-containing protein n=1 Tax=Heterosigma akashiwo TaxID=2829 RepID=A0A6S9HP31_HETAK